MPQPVDYIVVVSNEDDFHCGFHHFTERVNRKLKAGYQLLGQPFAMERLMCQALFKPANPEDGPAPAVESSGDTTMFYHRSAQS